MFSTPLHSLSFSLFQGIELVNSGPSNMKGGGGLENGQTEVPELIVDEQSLNVWYLGDAVFASPRINVEILLISPFIHHSGPTKTVFGWLYTIFVDFFSTKWRALRSDAQYVVEVSALDVNGQGLHLKATSLSTEYLAQVIADFVEKFIVGITEFMKADLTKSQKVCHDQQFYGF